METQQPKPGYYPILSITFLRFSTPVVFPPGWFVAGWKFLWVGGAIFLKHKPEEFGQIGKVSVIITTGPFNKTRVLGTCALHACYTPFL